MRIVRFTVVVVLVATLAACRTRPLDPDPDLSLCDTCVACVSNIVARGDTIRLDVCDAERVSVALGVTCGRPAFPDTVLECVRVEAGPPQTWVAVVPGGADAWLWVWRGGVVRTWACVSRDSGVVFAAPAP